MSAPTGAQDARWRRSRPGEPDIARMVGQYDRRGECWSTASTLSACAASSAGPFYAFPQISSTGLTSDAFAEELLREESVAVVPAAPSARRRGHVRCCYATSEAELREASSASSTSSSVVGVRRDDRAGRRRQERGRWSATRRHRHRDPLPAQDRQQDVLRLLHPRSTAAAPNSHCCPVCLGLPGVLPTINKRRSNTSSPPASRSRRRSPPRPAGIAISRRLCLLLRVYLLQGATRGMLSGNNAALCYSSGFAAFTNDSCHAMVESQLTLICPH